jgi:hypothetical protein
MIKLLDCRDQITNYFTKYCKQQSYFSETFPMNIGNWAAFCWSIVIRTPLLMPAFLLGSISNPLPSTWLRPKIWSQYLCHYQNRRCFLSAEKTCHVFLSKYFGTCSTPITAKNSNYSPTNQMMPSPAVNFTMLGMYLHTWLLWNATRIIGDFPTMSNVRQGMYNIQQTLSTFICQCLNICNFICSSSDKSCQDEIKIEKL